MALLDSCEFAKIRGQLFLICACLRKSAANILSCSMFRFAVQQFQRMRQDFDHCLQ
jgi:hypothetical protein